MLSQTLRCRIAIPETRTLFTTVLIGAVHLVILTDSARAQAPEAGQYVVVWNCANVDRSSYECSANGRLSWLSSHNSAGFIAFVEYETSSGLEAVRLFSPESEIVFPQMEAFAGPFATRDQADAWIARIRPQMPTVYHRPWIARVLEYSSATVDLRRQGAPRTEVGTFRGRSCGARSCEYEVTRASGTDDGIAVDAVPQTLRARLDRLSRGARVRITFRTDTILRNGRVLRSFDVVTSIRPYSQ